MPKAMFLAVIHEGDCESRYPEASIEVTLPDGVSVAEAQQEINEAMDAWREDHPDRCDEFGSAERDITINDVVAMIPERYGAKASDVALGDVFI